MSRIKWLAVAGVVTAVGVGVVLFYFHWRDHSQDVPIFAAARRYEMDPAVIKAVVWRESRFQSHIRGRAGEFGLMQITETAAREWAAAENIANFQPEHLLDSTTNTLAGTWYLRKLLRRYPQSDIPLAYALADYNAGRTHVLRWSKGAAQTNSAAFLQQMTFPGTRSYIIAVCQRSERYRATLPAYHPNP